MTTFDYDQVIATLKEIKEEVAQLEDNKRKLENDLKLRDDLALDIRRTLQWVIKIGNLKKSIDFFSKVFEMKVLRHEEFDAGCEAKCNGDFQRPWSKTMITSSGAIDGEKTNFALELTYNYGIKQYKRGNDLRFIGLNITKQGLQTATEMGYKCTPCDASQLFYDLFGPDQIKYRCKVTAKLPNESFWTIALNCTNIEKTFQFWCGTLNLQVK